MTAAAPVLVLYGPMMAGQRAAWEADYRIVQLAGGELPPAELADAIEVIASGDTVPNALIDALPALRLVACFSTGYTGIDLAHLASRGIALTTAGGVNAHDVADHAVALALALWHGIPAADRSVREGGWRESRVPRASLRGKHAGIIGLGRIGGAIAGRLAAHEMEVRWWGPHAKPGAPFARAANLADLAQWSDVLVVASRAAPENRHQVDAAVLAALGPTGMLVNISRGFLVDEEALISALRAGAIGGAALDVFEKEPSPPEKWDGVPNTVLTPHIAGYTQEAGIDMRRQQHENVRRHFAGEPLLTPVHDPL
ncbi:MAG: 2-hydroxyacid dehydrogenase [Novosphingobium sp.]|nr:2-hydroxyacid dehydrogenase [Novosphingobium sp.]